MRGILSSQVFATILVGVLSHPAGLVGQGTPTAPAPVVRLITGDPSRAGPFVERITFVAGFHINPHIHSVDFRERVIRGPLMMGLGGRFDTAQVVVVEAGNTVVVKAGTVHYDWWPEGGELEVSGVGPVQSTMVDSTGKAVAPH